MGMKARRRWAGVLVTAGILLSACSGVVATPSQSGGLDHQIVPPVAMSLSINNGTTLAVTLVVNGESIRTVAPGTQVDAIPASALPALPWAVEARSPSGRLLTSMTVNAGDVWTAQAPNGGSASKGDAVRIDLSCGRLDIWSGPPLLGPMPGPGSPGDCAP